MDAEDLGRRMTAANRLFCVHVSNRGLRKRGKCFAKKLTSAFPQQLRIRLAKATLYVHADAIR